MHEACSLVVQFKKTRLPPSSFICFWIVNVLLDYNASPVSEFFNGIGEGEVFVRYDKANGIATLATAKTVVGLPCRIDHERRSLFVMERAICFEVGAGTLQG